MKVRISGQNSYLEPPGAVCAVVVAAVVFAAVPLPAQHDFVALWVVPVLFASTVNTAASAVMPNCSHLAMRASASARVIPRATIASMQASRDGTGVVSVAAAVIIIAVPAALADWHLAQHASASARVILFSAMHLAIQASLSAAEQDLPSVALARLATDLPL